MRRGAVVAGWRGCALVVPAGGTSRRMGTDKLTEPLGASTVLGEMLARVPPGVPVAVVGPARAGLARRSPAVLTVREDPPGGGPAAAVAAGLAALRPAPSSTGGADVVAVCAGDAPWSPLVVPALVAALRSAPHAGAAVAVDAAGVGQPLVAVHRVAALRARLAVGEVAGASARWLLGPHPVEVAVAEHLLADVDTPEQLAAARLR